MQTSRSTNNIRSKKDLALFALLFFALLLFPVLGLAARGGDPGKPEGGDDEGGNNLSFPVIWAEEVTMPIPGTESGTVDSLAGEWWYWWGIEGEDPNNYEIKSCPPDPDDNGYCDDGSTGTAGEIPGCPPDPLYSDYCDDGIDGPVDPNHEMGTGLSDPNLVKAYLQKDPLNVWQAGNMGWSDRTLADDPLIVDWIDWGDSLEAVDWNTRSQVRTEVILSLDLDTSETQNATLKMTQYEMRHVDGWGINEVHGIAVKQGNALFNPIAPQATVYTPCARLTIQKLLVERDDPALAGLTWDGEENHLWKTDTGLINPPIFNYAIHEMADYSAEVNVKGKIIFGFTWNVRKLNDATVNSGEAAGDYRVTFSFDEVCGKDPSGATDSEGNPLMVDLNTYFVEPLDATSRGTRIFLPDEDPTSGDETNNETGGGTAVIDDVENLTYIDIRIQEKSGGKTK